MKQIQNKEILESKRENKENLKSPRLREVLEEKIERPFKKFLDDRVESFGRKAKKRTEISVRLDSEKLKLAKSTETRKKIERLKKYQKKLKEKGGISKKVLAPMIGLATTFYILFDKNWQKIEKFFKKTKENTEVFSRHFPKQENNKKI